MLNFYYSNESLSISPTEDPRTLAVTYTIGPNTYTGTVTRPISEIESLRTLVQDLQASINPPAAHAVDPL